MVAVSCQSGMQKLQNFQSKSLRQREGSRLDCKLKRAPPNSKPGSAPETSYYNRSMWS